METNNIEERAIISCIENQPHISYNCNESVTETSYKEGFINGVIEERDRCIRLAIKVYADLLSASGYDIGSINSELQRLRKAIEEGENNDN